MERDDIIALLDVQRKVFNDVIDRLQQEMKTNREETNEKIADLVKSLEKENGDNFQGETKL